MNEEERAQFIAIMKTMTELRLNKSADYGNSWKVYGIDGVVWQIRSKFIRMLNLLKTKKTPKNEPLRDTFMDMANYCIMAVQLIDMGKTEDSIENLLSLDTENHVQKDKISE